MTDTLPLPRPARVLEIIREVDTWLDGATPATYRDHPLGQDWARVAKASEEAGEAIAALIAFTGQNPRKGVCGSLDDLLAELADVACTGIFAIQHFTKDATRTAAVVAAGLEKAMSRATAARQANTPGDEWACRRCADAWFGTQPEDELCSACRENG